MDLAWRAFRAFLTVPLGGLFDRSEGEMESDTLVTEFPVTDWSDDRPGLLFARQFAVPAVEWHHGAPADPASEEVDLSLADTVQIEMELRFPHGTTADAEDFWTAPAAASSTKRTLPRQANPSPGFCWGSRPPAESR